MGVVLAAGALAGTPSELAFPPVGSAMACTFTEACIDRRPCFDSRAQVAVQVVDEALALMDLGDGQVRPARIKREGVWTSYQTEPDRDHGLRTVILDMAEDGRATLVVTSPGEAVDMLSRTGTCIRLPASEETPQ
ncbi:hypothetical protein AB0T83_11480 [Fluviibacterium sp. DFM31]|uniref:Uncharacterized protein n=1 Tax=Meridianimarinicoccus marinus TaxID=3231483 RepID=A0ABV3L748_9RHOB